MAPGFSRVSAARGVGPAVSTAGRLGRNRCADFAHWVRQHRPKLAVEVVKRTDELAGFRGVPQRWVVERTLAWLTQHRRLVRDYERSEASATAWIYAALIRIMLRRLA